ncbi:MAG: hypothetical protein KJ592_03635 [Nanoarchaeota archaeon]|nr:hypothetical protein [Nanoarchaeota archaeon]
MEKMRLASLLVFVLISLTGFAVADVGGDYSMMGNMMFGGYGYGGMFYGWVFGLLVLIILVLIIAWLLKEISRKK